MMDMLQAIGAIQFATVVEAKRAACGRRRASNQREAHPRSAQSKRYQRTFKG
jgi:hypothetical protein